MSVRQRRLREIGRRLGSRPLIYWGSRGADAESLMEFNRLERVFSIIMPLGSEVIRDEKHTCLEWMDRRRRDLDGYSAEAQEKVAGDLAALRSGLLTACRRRVALLPYRACPILSSAWFPRVGNILHLGMFHEHQACFENKPWVETQLRNRLNLPMLEWRYVAESETSRIDSMVRRGPVVVRASRSQGGEGFVLLHPSQSDRRLRHGRGDGFVAVSRFLKDAVPVNVNACVFPGGTVTLHGASIQLIGIPSCTRRPFGYCGNDFGAIKERLDGKRLDGLETMVRKVGRWMASQGYVGAFGIDALLHRGRVIFSELNPRFQGSSTLTARIDRDLGRPDIFMDHISAHLGLPPAGDLRLRDLVSAQPHLAQILVHNTTQSNIRLPSLKARGESRFHFLPQQSGVRIDPGAIMFALWMNEHVTSNGRSLFPGAASVVDASVRALSAGTVS